MSRLRLLIKRPGRVNTCIPVTVEDTALIGNCISSLVDHLGLPWRDSLGRVLTYSFRPLSGGQPLSSTLRFVDAGLLPETRLLLELDNRNAAMQRADASMIGDHLLATPMVQQAVAPPCQIMSRRAFVTKSILIGCAVSGLCTGIATELATRRRGTPLHTMTPPSLPPPRKRLTCLEEGGSFQTINKQCKPLPSLPDPAEPQEFPAGERPSLARVLSLRHYSIG